MMAIMRAKTPPLVLRDMFLKGLRLDGKAALQKGLVDLAVPGDSVLKEAIALAKSMGEKAHTNNRRTIAVLKFEMVRQYVDILTDGEGQKTFDMVLSKL